MDASAKDWAIEQFATLELGDRRREYRAVRMLRRAAERPAGRLSEVFDSPAELQGAYDFVEGDFGSERVVRALEDATLRAADGLDFMYVVLDGTSLTLTDRAKCKDFGSIGPRETLARGLKVVDALALTPEGVPLGLLDLKFWARKPLSRTARYWRRQGPTTETRHWVETLERVGERAARAGVKPWFVIDREGDCADMLRAAALNGALFTIRSNQNRLLRPGTSRQRLLRQHMKHRPVLGRHFIRVPGKDGTLGSPVALDVRVSSVDLDVPNYRTHPKMREALPLHVVWLRERHPPRGRKALDWMLLTNHAVVDYAAAIAVLESYCCRWRIEDFHRTWKTGRCFVEDTLYAGQRCSPPLPPESNASNISPGLSQKLLRASNSAPSRSRLSVSGKLKSRSGRNHCPKGCPASRSRCFGSPKWADSRARPTSSQAPSRLAEASSAWPHSRWASKLASISLENETSAQMLEVGPQRLCRWGGGQRPPITRKLNGRA